MKHFFVLGRNPELSRLEILSFLEVRSIKYEEVCFDNNLLILETDFSLNIQEFGGVISLGKILFEGRKKEFKEYLKEKEIILSDKFTYSVLGNEDIEILKEKFKHEKKKAMLKHGRKKIKFQSGEEINLPDVKYIILLYNLNGIIYFGIVDQEYSHREVEYRDVNKPVRRAGLAISPRLSKILINLSCAKKGDLFLDPFCGVGGVIQEALLKNIESYGVDKDKNAIKDAERNLEWLKKEYKIKTRYSLKNMDSKNFGDLRFDAVATETPFGDLLKKKLDNSKAEKFVLDFEEFIVPFLKRLKEIKKEKARIAITFPVVRNFRVNVDNVSKLSGLRVIYGPIQESRPDQFVSRDIVVLR